MRHEHQKMKNEIQVALVDDHPLYREGLVQALAACPDFEIAAQGASATDATEIVRNHHIDVLVLDIGIPGGGIAALRSITEYSPDTKVLMLTVSDSPEDVLKTLNLGAMGYVVKGASGAEVAQALRAVAAGDLYLSPSLGAHLLSEVSSGKAISKTKAFVELSSREDEILALVGQGLTNKEIGLQLSLTEKTVKHYMTGVFQKLRVHTRLEAALLSQQESFSHPKPNGRQPVLAVSRNH